MGIIDLHVHTKYSDGEYLPLEILNICNEKNISVVAIADHNTTEGAREAILNNPYDTITIIPAIEFSADCPTKGASCHILGYGIDVENTELNNLSNRMREENAKKVVAIIAALKEKFNLSFNKEDVDNVLNNIGNIGKPDVARLCVKYGYCTTISEAFDKFIKPVEKTLVMKRYFPTAIECIQYIHNAGGIACLAHPIELLKADEELEEYIKNLAKNRLDASELYQSQHTEEYSEMLLKIANKYNLLYTVGSDYHGPFITPDFEIGSGKNNNLNKTYASILNIL